MPKKYRIHLTEDERVELKALISSKKAAAPKRLRAQILLAADEDHTGGALKDAEIVRAPGVGVCTVERTRCALAEHGLQIAVHGQPPQFKISRRKLDGAMEAKLVAAACGTPPEGRARWPLKLLGDHLVTLGLVESVSPQTIGRVLKKTN